MSMLTKFVQKNYSNECNTSYSLDLQVYPSCNLSYIFYHIRSIPFVQSSIQVLTFDMI